MSNRSSLRAHAQVFRFYFRCNACAAEMTMKTDPEHADYTVEQGATRNYEPWREKDRWARGFATLLCFFFGEPFTNFTALRRI